MTRDIRSIINDKRIEGYTPNVINPNGAVKPIFLEKRKSVVLDGDGASFLYFLWIILLNKNIQNLFDFCH